MSDCPHCGKELEPESKFCGICGAEIEATGLSFPPPPPPLPYGGPPESVKLGGRLRPGWIGWLVMAFLVVAGLATGWYLWTAEKGKEGIAKKMPMTPSPPHSLEGTHSSFSPPAPPSFPESRTEAVISPLQEGEMRFSMRLETLTSELARSLGLLGSRGLLVVGVDPGSKLMGLQMDDIIVEVNGRPINDGREIETSLETLKVLRQGKLETLIFRIKSEERGRSDY